MFQNKIQKRTGEVVVFDPQKITLAINKAMLATNIIPKNSVVKKMTSDVVEEIKKTFPNGTIPTVENVQDSVEKALMKYGFYDTAKAYILYRQKREEVRKAGGVIINDEVKKAIKEQSKNYFRNPLSEFVYYASYARWIPEKGRRETWVETVDRFMDFMKDNLGNKLTKENYTECREAILNQEVIPSMRLIWSSGLAAKNSNVTAYNCSYIKPTTFQDFGEIMYISMCGTGVGFSVERSVADSFPTIQAQTGKKLPTHKVGDSKEGWADAYVLALKTWFEGNDIDFDYSQVRPKGSRLKTMGGRASGPEPLVELMQFTKERILAHQNGKLSSLDWHDIACKIGEIVVAGGVRRSAMISLSDLNDVDMRHAKDGQFWLTNGQRSMANNSAIYNTKPSSVEFMEEWLSLAKSGSGERGIFNRSGLKNQLPKRRWESFEKHLNSCGTNPCGEIILRSKQFCNLTSVIVRQEDDLKNLLRKTRIASLLGTYQAALTKFVYLSPEWKKNCQEEALLGVSFTGYFDNKLIRSEKILKQMRDLAIKANKEFSEKIGINPSTCVTCVKPSGNSSQLLDTASGMHPRYAKYYIRRVRIMATDPLFTMLKDQGVPYHPEVGQTEANATTYVLEFPIKAPPGAITRHDLTALDMLEHWKMIKQNFTEHNPSATIYVEPQEWLEVGDWVYKNFDEISGLTFLPKSEHNYQLAPYEEIDQATYKKLLLRTANVDFSKLVSYEQADNTKGAKEFACVGGACEI